METPKEFQIIRVLQQMDGSGVISPWVTGLDGRVHVLLLLRAPVEAGSWAILHLCSYIVARELLLLRQVLINKGPFIGELQIL